MPSRNQSMIRRDINRLNETIQRHKEKKPALAAISSRVAAATDKVNAAWQEFQAKAVAGDREREERETAISFLIDWIQNWRPVMMIIIPGADANIRNLPSSGATPDDVIRVAEDMIKFINNNPAAQEFRESALNDMGEGLENAKKETMEATASLPAEAAARHAYSEACVDANPILVGGLTIVRSMFGRTSPEYKLFIARADSEEEEEEAEAITAS